MSANQMEVQGESWMTTRLDTIAEWAQRHSFWPLPFGTACCAIEFMGTVSSHYDMARFGYEVVRFSPRQSEQWRIAIPGVHFQSASMPPPKSRSRCPMASASCATSTRRQQR